jgi:hypothetical protein
LGVIGPQSLDVGEHLDSQHAADATAVQCQELAGAALLQDLLDAHGVF